MSFLRDDEKPASPFGEAGSGFRLIAAAAGERASRVSSTQP
jgi:hypothetical protein